MIFQILSRDSVTVSVDAVVYFNVVEAELALCSVDDFSHSTRLLAATTLRYSIKDLSYPLAHLRIVNILCRNVLGTKNLSQILAEREQIAGTMQVSSTIDI